LTILESALLGFLQGMTEFLPISSSGHLVLAETLLQFKSSDYLFFDILLHLATLVAVCIFFRVRLMNMAVALFSFLQKRESTDAERFDRILFFALFLSTVVTGVLGISFRYRFEAMRDHLTLVGAAFLLMGVILLATRKCRTDESSESSSLPINIWLFALIMGLAQTTAITPGISRSGTTVAVALLIGVSRRFAVEYSFLMSIPAILGAAALEWRHAKMIVDMTPAIIGFVVSLVSGIIFLWLLVWLVQKERLYQFSFYLFALGTIVLVYSLT
jgi:undecaprenyl-diphosphatase